jgi:hypothetical protein
VRRRKPPPSQKAWQQICVAKTLWPPQPGTLRLKRHYGAALVCVRYRIDSELGHRYTTVELMIDHAPAWPGHRKKHTRRR